MLADYHIHTIFSDDSEENMEVAVQHAITAGLEEICFTDHVDYGIKIDHDHFKSMDKAGQQKYQNLLNVDYPAYFKELNHLKEKYRHKIQIRSGLEFGVQVHTIPQYQKIFGSWPLDFVILSCHQTDNKEFWNYEVQKLYSIEECNTMYYQEIYNSIRQYKDYSILGHLDFIQRYNETRYPLKRSLPIIEKILLQAIKDNKGIEVNTSSFRYHLPDLTPEHKILELYYELGGRIITTGSDAHKATDIGDHIPQIQKELKRIGYHQFCTFQNMQPIFHSL